MGLTMSWTIADANSVSGTSAGDPGSGEDTLPSVSSVRATFVVRSQTTLSGLRAGVRSSEQMSDLSETDCDSDVARERLDDSADSLLTLLVRERKTSLRS